MARIPRVEALLGITRIDNADEAALDRLVNGSVTEGTDLEYKSELYGGNDSSKQELAKDVAAMANLRGGLIIIGVAEDEQGAASGLPRVELSDAEQLRMHQIIASNVAPVPAFDIRPVASDSHPGTGYYLIAVERTAGAPHAVTRNESLRYPVRSGTTTRWLSESEVADAYRDRFAGERSQLERLDRIHQEGLGRLSADGGWTVVSLVPNIPGATGWGIGVLRQVQAWWDHRPRLSLTAFDQISGHEVRVGFRRFLASDIVWSGQPDAGACHAELHSDGSAFVAVRAMNAIEGQGGEGVSERWLTYSLVASLDEAAAFARDVAGVHGDAAIRAQLYVPTDTRVALLGTYGLGGERPIGEASNPTAENTLSIDDLTGPVTSRLAAARLPLNDLCSAFGVAETNYIAQDGQLLLQKFDQHYQAGWQPWMDSLDAAESPEGPA